MSENVLGKYDQMSVNRLVGFILFPESHEHFHQCYVHHNSNYIQKFEFGKILFFLMIVLYLIYRFFILNIILTCFILCYLDLFASVVIIFMIF